MVVWSKAILVMLATGITDLFWTLYVTSAAGGNRWRASLYASCIVLLGGYSITQYINDPIMLIPAAIGAFLGTFIPLSLKRGFK